MNIKYIRRLIVLTLALLLVVSCTNSVTDDLTNKEEINVYFVDQLNGELVSEQVFSDPKETDTDAKKLQFAIESLKNGPNGSSLLPVVPDNIIIKGAKLSENGVQINLSEDYNNLTVQEQMIMRASFVRTLTNFPFINWVEFLVENKPLQSAEGEPIGPIFKEDVIIVQPDPKPPTNVQNIVLYFGNERGDKLVAENRKIQVSSNVPLERYIMEELIKGPQNSKNIYTVPPETKINDIKTKDGVCQLDLSAEFKTKHQGGATGELFTIYSIVNSLTESSPKVKKVTFLIDGKKQTEFKGYLDLSVPFERDEALIEEDK